MHKRISLILCIIIGVVGTAAAGDKPLGLDSVVPEDGATDVALETAIDLTFSNNVVNFSVADANRTCFALVPEGGDPVEIQVVLADDQIEPEKKRLIRIVPAAPLSPNTTYVLRISGDLEAKNGRSLGDDLRISFTTTP